MQLPVNDPACKYHHTGIRIACMNLGSWAQTVSSLQVLSFSSGDSSCSSQPLFLSLEFSFLLTNILLLYSPLLQLMSRYIKHLLFKLPCGFSLLIGRTPKQSRWGGQDGPRGTPLRMRFWSWFGWVFGLEGSALLLASGKRDKSNPWCVVTSQFVKLSQRLMVIKCQLRHRGTSVSIWFQKCRRVPLTSNSHKFSHGHSLSASLAILVGV